MNHQYLAMVAVVSALAGGGRASGQAAHGQTAHLPGVRVGGQAIGLVTHATPAEAGDALTEGYLTQPNLFVHAAAFGGRAAFVGTLNFEGVTLRRGELNAGASGEGYIDRRHPHTYVHEAMVSLRTSAGATAFSLSAGRGFAPFGTDDPMVRPLVKFPANHHLSQILERLVAIGAVRRGAATIEAALFSGPEPLEPEDLGNLDRFGDSWAVRLTVQPSAAIELQASHARVESPEQPTGAGLDQHKWDVSARYERGGWYGLVEWALSREYDDGEFAFELPSVLAEGGFAHGRWRFAGRAEQTTRTEDERSAGIFRTPWPHVDGRVLGMTRWQIYSVAATRAFSIAGIRVAPLVEVSHQRPAPTTRPSLFEPRELYGSDRLWSVSAGVRLGAGMQHRRMGRYGVADSTGGPSSHQATGKRGIGAGGCLMDCRAGPPRQGATGVSPGRLNERVNRRLESRNR